MFRPEGWDKDRILTDKWWDECDGLDSVGLVEEAFEAGADAMLEGLKRAGKLGWMLSDGSFMETTLTPRAHTRGYEVFIPEEVR